LATRQPHPFFAYQSGLANNLNGGISQGILPIFLAEQGLNIAGIGVLQFV
jgi:hypothetical protein